MRATLKILFFCIHCFWFPAKAQTYTLVTFNNSATDTLSTMEVDRLNDEHLQYIRELTKTGDLLAAGAFEKNNGGVFILNSPLQKTKDLLNHDPALIFGLLNYRYFEVISLHGKFCPYEQEFELKDFYFIQYEVHYTKESIRATEKTYIEHQGYIKSIIKSGEVAFWGKATNVASEFMIYSGNNLKHLTEDDYAVRQEFMLAEINTLTIAKESICK